ncbi:hypothetical protein HED50_22185 [Ochrobactrum oryzae]|nr:hypothetical protein [Brucella oryzae]
MSKNVPFTWEQIEGEIRKAIWVSIEAIGIFCTNEAYRGMLGDSNAEENTLTSSVIVSIRLSKGVMHMPISSPATTRSRRKIGTKPRCF